MKNLNKKGWLRIIESVIAILIVFGAVLYIVSKQNHAPDPSDMIYEKQNQILEIVSKNETLRQLLLDKQEDKLKSEILRFVPISWNYSVCITNITLICSPEIPHDRDVYVTEKMITSTLNYYSPKKLRFFVWAK